MPCSRTTAILTGACGFLGSSLRHALAAQGVSVIPAPAGARDVSAHARCEILFDELKTALLRAPVDVIFHLAGSGTPFSELFPPHYHYWTNVGTTNALVRAIEATRFCGRIVYCSSASVYGNSGVGPATEDGPLEPCTEYGEAKVLAEQCLMQEVDRRCEVRIARVFHAFGPGQCKLVVYDLAKKLVAEEQPFTVKSTGEEVRDFVFVDDVVRALIFLSVELPRGNAPLILNVCSGVPTRIGDLARRLLCLEGRGEHELCFEPAGMPNSIKACVGDPARLSAVGITLPPISTQHLAATVSWIRNGGVS